MIPEPAVELSDELLALFSRAELTVAQARRLLDENDRWRQRVVQHWITCSSSAPSSGERGALKRDDFRIIMIALRLSVT